MDVTHHLVVLVESVNEDDIELVLSGSEEGIGCDMVRSRRGVVRIHGNLGWHVNPAECCALVRADLKERFVVSCGYEFIDDIVPLQKHQLLNSFPFFFNSSSHVMVAYFRTGAKCFQYLMPA